VEPRVSLSRILDISAVLLPIKLSVPAMRALPCAAVSSEEDMPLKTPAPRLETAPMPNPTAQFCTDERPIAVSSVMTGGLREDVAAGSHQRQANVSIHILWRRHPETSANKRMQIGPIMDRAATASKRCKGEGMLNDDSCMQNAGSSTW
jgi:hypothetical protein